MSILTREGFRSLRVVYGVALAGVGVAAFLVAGSYFYWQSEKKNDVQSIRTLQDLRNRLETAKRERDDLRDSEQTYKALAARGVFIAEQRLDLIEALAALKLRHKLVSLEYEIGPQRLVRLFGGAVLLAIDPVGSRVKLKIRAYHDGDLFAFLDEFPRFQRGFFPLDRCTIRRAAEFEQQEKAAAAIAGKERIDPSKAAANDGQARPPDSDLPRTRPSEGVLASAKAAIEAECSLEWITLVDKRNQLAAQVAAAPPVR
jgi:hypothetical protein